jgi:hypothetical protein
MVIYLSILLTMRNVSDKIVEKIKTHILFNIYKSVHHRTIQVNHQPDAKVFQFIIVTFIYSLTCFGRFPAHHQEINAAVVASGFTFVSW